MNNLDEYKLDNNEQEVINKPNFLEDMDTAHVEDIEIDGIDDNDHPDYVDAYISDATYKGLPMTDEQLDEINENTDFVYDCVIAQIF